MKNKITQFSKLLFAGAAVVFFFSCARNQTFESRMQENDAKTVAVTKEQNFEASTEPKSLLSVTEVKETQFAAEPVTQAAAPKTVKKGAKMNPLKAVVAIHKINKMIKEAKAKEIGKLEKVKSESRNGGLSANMKLGILIALIGLIVAILGGYVSWILGVLGIIALIIGLVIIIIELVNNM